MRQPHQSELSLFSSFAMTRIKVLIIEKKSGNRDLSFYSALASKGYNVIAVKDVESAIASFSKKPVNVVVLNAASLKTSGVRMSQQLCEGVGGTPIVLISSENTQYSANGVVQEIIHHPFTIRKLSNCISRYTPGPAKDLIKAGPIRMDVKKCVVKCRGRVTKLTPQAVSLLLVFMLSPGHLFSRQELMKRIWKTDYMGDTRTLDVHIRWLRKAIEEAPSSPVMLRTIRGVGYCLRISE